MEFWKFLFVCLTYFPWVQPFSHFSVTGWHGGTCTIPSLLCLAYTVLNYLLFFFFFSHIFTAFLVYALQSCKGRSQSSELFVPQQHGESLEAEECLLSPESVVCWPLVLLQGRWGKRVRGLEGYGLTC